MDKVVVMSVLAVIIQSAAAQNVHIVGDDVGWTVPLGSFSYSSWASGKTFMVGDILVFNFSTGQHDVVRVPPASYDACRSDDAIGDAITAGPANVTLDAAGDHRYLCAVGRHCQNGQKLAITVVASSSGGAIPPSTPTTGACAPTEAAGVPRASMSPRGAPPPPNGSASASPAAVLVMASVAGPAALLF